MMELLLIAAVLAVIGASQFVDLRRQREVRLLMDGVLTHRGQATVDEIALLVRENKHYLGRHIDEADAMRRAGCRAEAIASLYRGTAVIAELAPDFLTALRSLRRLSRCVSAIVVVPPVSVRAFQTARLRGLAGGAVALHYLLLTGRQRVALRLHLVAAAFGLSLGWLRSAAAGWARDDRAAQWRRIEDLVADLGTTGDEALVAARQVAEALDAVEFGPALAHRLRS
jgi:hypothetical protein